jgi:hypothetical protein
MKSYEREFFMRYCWEMDGSRQSVSEIGKPAEFIDAWRYIWNRFKLANVDNVIWNFSTNAARFKDPNDSGYFAWDYYPGDTYVDWVSADGYNWHGAAGRNDRYRRMLEIYDEFMIWARSSGPVPQSLRDVDPDFPATFPNKTAVEPIMVAEYGTQEQADGGTDKGNWFRDAHETVMGRTASTPASCTHCGAYSDIAAMVYFDVSGKSADSEGGWDIETTDKSLAGYQQYANDPWFHQIETLTWGPYTGSVPAPDPTPTPTPTPDPTPAPTPTPDPGTPAPAASERSGYWMLGSDGKVYSFGDAKGHGDAPIAGATIGVVAVDVEPTPSGAGYWIVDSTGRVFSRGDAGSFGNVTTPLAFGETVTSLSSTPTGNGYWIFTSKGRALNFGDAVHLGDMSAVKLNGPVLDSIPTPSGHGYYMVASDGGIFTFGDAVFHGSTGNMKLNAPVQSLVPNPLGGGYWLVASDGGVFTFGNVPFRGSMGDKKLNQPVTGMVPYGNGYLMVAEDGGIFTFSDRPFSGSLGDKPPANPIVAVAPFHA